MDMNFEKEIQKLDFKDLTYAKKVSNLRKFVYNWKNKDFKPKELIDYTKILYKKAYSIGDDSEDFLIDMFLDSDFSFKDKSPAFMLPYFHTYRGITYLVLVTLVVKKDKIILGRLIFFDTLARVGRLLSANVFSCVKMDITEDYERTFDLKFDSMIDIIKSVPTLAKSVFKKPKQEAQATTSKELLTQQLNLLQLQMNLIQQQLDSMNN